MTPEKECARQFLLEGFERTAHKMAFTIVQMNISAIIGGLDIHYFVVVSNEVGMMPGDNDVSHGRVKSRLVLR